jgi:Xaa-Pro aminopeptidase
MKTALLLAVLPFACLLRTQSPAAQDKGSPEKGPPANAPAQPPALGRDFHRGRRQELMKRVGTGVILVRGSSEPGDYMPFLQNHEFFYLTGVRDPGCELILCPETGEEILFAPPYNKGVESWVGPRLAPGRKGVEQTGIEHIEAAPALQRVLAECVEKAKEKVIRVPFEAECQRAGSLDLATTADTQRAKDPFDGRGSRTDALRKALQTMFPDAKVADVAPQLHELRLVKTDEEIAAERYTCRVSALGVAEAMRSCHPGLFERQLAAAADFVFQREGAQGVSYGAIVGAGKNACMLHYMLNTKLIADGELVLMDFAADCGGYVSDVTRTFPANGKFTPEQQKVYQAVLDAQQAVIAAVKPGVKLADAEGLGHVLLEERGYRPYIRHGFCHSVGLAVHDVGPLFQGPLAAGMVFTVEPGVYMEKEGVGVRIEDVVLVTADGCEVLSRDCPREVSAIEKLMAEKGVLER